MDFVVDNSFFRSSFGEHVKLELVTDSPGGILKDSNFGFKFLVAFFALLGISSEGAGQDVCPFLLELGSPLKRAGNTFSNQVLNGTFQQRRTINHYDRFTGRRFLKTALELSPDSVYIDMGAGAALVQRKLFTLFPKNQSPYLLSLGYKMQEVARQEIGEFTKLANGKFFYLEGAQNHKTLLGLPRADLITDVFGIISYCKDREQILESYLKLIKPNGKIMIYTSHAHHIEEIFLKRYSRDSRFKVYPRRGLALVIERLKD